MFRTLLPFFLTLSACSVGIQGNVSTDLNDGVPLGMRRIFLTSTNYAGNFATTTGSVNGPCTVAKVAAGLRLNYSAVLSTSTQDAVNVVIGSTPIYKLSGTTAVLVADGASELWNGQLHAFIDSDEYGNTHIGTARAWTGSTTAGVHAAGMSCSDWEIMAFAPAAVGHAGFLDLKWIRNGNSVDCTLGPSHRGVYCISN